VTPEQLALLGLAVGASDADVTAPLAALKSQATQAEQIEPLKTEIAALKAGSPSAPEGFVPMAGYLELQSEVAALKASTAANDNAKLVDDALKDGRLMPSMKDWALALATSNKPQLEAFLQKAAPIAALNKQQSSTVSLPKVGIAQLSAEDKKHAETLGFSPEQYLQFKEQN
jgi:phage I-like protein